ncbi:MAG: ComF family protein [Porticoccaceae bacterium]
MSNLSGYSRNFCWFCLASVNRLTAPLCQSCLADLRYIKKGCHVCALPLPDNGICPECQHLPPPFCRAHIPLIYTELSARLIDSLKHKLHSPSLPLLAHLIAERLIERPADFAALTLIAMPAHPRRTLERGFSQAARLTHALAAHFPGQHHITPSARLRRHSYRQSQQGLPRKQRLHNLRNAFSATGVAGLTVGLVDDVVTTTATARAASAALLAAGAVQVELIAVSRTPQPGPKSFA